MGCDQARNDYEQSSEEANIMITNVFDGIPLRRIKIKDFQDDYEEIIQKKNENDEENYISETEFQEIVIKYLLPEGEESALTDYWFDLYKSIGSNKRMNYLKFLLSLFCDYSNLVSKYNKEVLLMKNAFNEIFKGEDFKYEKNKNKEDEAYLSSEIYHLKTDIVKLISFYIEFITFKTVKHFKYMDEEPDVFYKEHKNDWKREAIEPYIYENYINPIEDVSGHREYISLDLFMKENLKKIRDGYKIRKELSILSKKYQDEIIGEKNENQEKEEN